MENMLPFIFGGVVVIFIITTLFESNSISMNMKILSAFLILGVSYNMFTSSYGEKSMFSDTYTRIVASSNIATQKTKQNTVFDAIASNVSSTVSNETNIINSSLTGMSKESSVSFLSSFFIGVR